MGERATGCTCTVIIRCPSTCLEANVRTTLALDDDLVLEAQRLTGTKEKGALVRQALGALIERESASRLAGGDGEACELDAGVVVMLFEAADSA